MTLDYTIIWVDDMPAWVDSVKSEIEEHLADEGFQAAIEVRESGEGLVQECKTADPDLIIVDFRLPGGENGDDLIRSIRASGALTEIVFYSQENVPELAADGIFACERGDAEETIKKAIDLTIHKMKDVKVVRGLVIAAAIDLEVKLEELMIRSFGDKGGLFKQRILDKPFLFDFQKKSDFILGFSKDWMKEAQPEDLVERLKAARGVLKDFVNEVITPRNLLAHAKPEEKDGKVVLMNRHKSAEVIEIDREWLARMRENLRKHRQNLEEIEACCMPSK